MSLNQLSYWNFSTKIIDIATKNKTNIKHLEMSFTQEFFNSYSLSKNCYIFGPYMYFDVKSDESNLHFLEMSLLREYRDYDSARNSILLGRNDWRSDIEQNIYDVQKKYDYELQQNVYQKRLNKRLLILICILLTLLLVLIVSFVLITNSRRREKLLSEQLEDLSNVNNYYERFKYEVNESLKNSLKERFNIIRKVSIIEHNNKTDENLKKIKEYAFGSINKTAFEASVCVIESVYNNITSFIKDTYPELTETEYKVCLLSIAPISVNDIAVISGLSIDTISKSRSNIRKKLKIEDNKIKSIILNMRSRETKKPS